VTTTSDSVKVLTIHKAKGLEFDVVIVPGLHAEPQSDDSRLFMWMETPQRSLLLAPISATGNETDPVYRFMREVEKQKADHENARLLYVAATRARRELHLLGCARVDEEGAAKEPPKASLLRKLWPIVCDEFANLPAGDRDEGLPRVVNARQGLLRRIDTQSLRYDVPPAVAWQAVEEVRAVDALEFSWVGDTARRIGSVVHRRLQRIAEDEARGWSRARIEKERPALRRELAARGVAESDLDRAVERAANALAQALEDERGRWLLGPQRGARNEYRISTWGGGVRRMLVIDRFFEGENGLAWIVDYKTSGHEGADVEGFLDEERKRYHDQLERYAAALGKPDSRRGLYFPLLKGWREWS
jgi:ATP-dependent exoDNAse (exonuclease V) beta subunit